MISGPVLPCPECKRKLDTPSWHSATHGSCWHCRKDFQFVEFPARTASRRRISAKSVEAAEQAACFYHSSNQAETVCEGCGRFVCAICGIEFGGRKICPPCIEITKETDVRAITHRTLYDGIALVAAGLPLLVWPVTLVTAPVALGIVIVGWRKPRSLVSNNRVKLILAGVIALIQIAAWTALFVFRWAK